MTVKYEYKVNIDGADYTMADLTSCTLQQALLDSFSVGGACAAQFDVSYCFYLEPKRMATVIPYCRVAGSSDTWHQLGIFYVDTRSAKSGLKTLTCYDAMMKADVKYISEGVVDQWPKSQLAAAQEIASLMDVQLDSRTVINSTYVVEYPNDDTMREVLGYIAAASGGNWIITAEGKLLLVPLFTSMPAETFFLIDQSGDNLLFGDVRILV